MNNKLSKKQLRRQSIIMSKILRHSAVKMGLKMDEQGFILVKDLLKVKRLKNMTLDLLRLLVETNDKKRYELKQIDGIFYIRAVQGHSIDLDDSKLYQDINSTDEIKDVVIHGTFSQFWHLIEATGLNSMTRTHIHMSTGYPGDKKVISGMRKTCDIFIEIDIPLALKNKRKFQMSKNGVILCRGINKALSPIFFKKVYKKTDKGKELIFGNSNLNELKKKYCFRYLLVLDFEANSERDEKIVPQEIIEFPIVVIDTEKMEIMKDKIFHSYVKPTVKQLTPFITELTHITKDMIKDQPDILEVLKNAEEFVKSNFKEDEYCFVTCGDFDFRCLAREAFYKKFQYSDVFKKYINIKDVFNCFTGVKQKTGMKSMLEHFKLPLDGHHHSGIDDSKNIAKIMLSMLQTDFLVTQNFRKIIKDKTK